MESSKLFLTTFRVTSSGVRTYWYCHWILHWSFILWNCFSMLELLRYVKSSSTACMCWSSSHIHVQFFSICAQLLRITSEDRDDHDPCTSACMQCSIHTYRHAYYIILLIHISEIPCKLNIRRNKIFQTDTRHGAGNISRSWRPGLRY